MKMNERENNSDKMNERDEKNPDEMDKVNEKNPAEMVERNERNEERDEMDEIDERQSLGLSPAANPWVDSSKPGDHRDQSSPLPFAFKLE